MFYDGVKIDDVKSLDESTYIPGGMTALNDAIGFVIDTVEKRHSTLKTKPNTMLVILTDGQENSSAEYTLEQIKNQIEKVKKDGWEVLYIGASVDAFTQDQMRNYSGHIQTMYLGCRTIEASFANLNSHVTNYIKDKKDKK
jgi:Mg-chelatase subunit ChlD